MNKGIELHDSRLASISYSGDEAVVSLAPAYVHRSTGRPGIDAGAGWSQRATLTFVGTTSVVPSRRLPATISGGSLRMGDVTHCNIIPASGSFEGVIEFSILLSTTESLVIRGLRVSIQLHDESSFVESFNP